MAWADDQVREARALLKRASQLGEKLEIPGEQSTLYEAIARALIKAGDKTGALALARSFEPGLLRNSAYGAIAESQAAAGNLKEALKTAHFIGDPYHNSRAIEAVVLEYVRSSNFKSAIETAQLIKSDVLRIGALTEIAAAQVKAGDTVGAFQLVDRAQDDYGKSRIVGGIAAAQVEQGENDAALKTAANFKGKSFSDWPLYEVAKALARAGNLRMAREMAEKLREQLRFVTWEEIAVEQAKMGDVKGALELASSIPRPIHRYDNLPSVQLGAIGRIANAQAQTGDFKGALETAALIPPDVRGCDICGSYKDEVIGKIGRIRAERKQYLAALEIAGSLKFYEKEEIIKTVAVTQADDGEIENALQTVSTIENIHYRATTFQRISLSWTKTGKKAAALAWAEKLSAPLERAHAMVGIADGLLSSKR